MRPLKVAFLWHMHQPMYQEKVAGRFLLPWVRLHATKSYYDMPAVLARHKKAKASFNITPSLLLQIEEYFKDDIREKDEFLRLSLKPADQLEPHEKEFILANFFMNNWDRVIKPHPRYSELLHLRGEVYKSGELNQIINRFTNQDMIDLQVLFNLCWFGFGLRKKNARIREIFKKQRNYSEDDKIEVVSIQLSSMRDLLNLYKKLHHKGQIEITTTPFYHPILPLLFNNNEGGGFNWKEDAEVQLRKGAEFFEKCFGFKPKGLWPSEGSVSEAVAGLASEAGFQWMGTDEEILFHSLPGNVAREKILYAPYTFERDGKSISIFFRDKKLSDLIGFSYSNSDAELAVNDFLNRLRKIYELTSHQADQPVVSVILDGENAWEHYEKDGETFLDKLYDRLSKESWMELVRFEDVMPKAGHERKLESLFTGSWINHNFDIWYGHQEDKQAWDYLYKTREFLMRGEIPEEKRAEAWEELYIAEGSDWFWWYGDEFSSHTQDIFDFLFRNHLMNIYRLADKRIPSFLQKPIKKSGIKKDYIEEPTALISPVIDGKITSFYEWSGAGHFRSIEPAGAMSKGEKWIRDIYYGVDQDNLYLRIDFDEELIQNQKTGIRCQIYLATIDEFILEFELESGDLSFFQLLMNDKQELKCFKQWAAFKKNLEVSIPFNSINAPVRNNIEMRVSIFKDQIKLEEVPQFGILLAVRPDVNLEKSYWSL